MNTIYWHMNATKGSANLHPGVNLLPDANLHPGANCAHEHGFSYFPCIVRAQKESFDTRIIIFTFSFIFKEGRLNKYLESKYNTH